MEVAHGWQDVEQQQEYTLQQDASVFYFLYFMTSCEYCLFVFPFFL
jgi:hypothetical protein